MVWHEDELVHLHSVLLSMCADDIQEKFAKTIRLQEAPAFRSRERHKESSNFLPRKSQG